MTSLTASQPWKLTSPAAMLSWVLVAFLLMLSTMASLDPVGAADGFGLPIASGDALPWLRIKAGRDLGLGLILLTVLLQRRRRLFGAVTLVSMVIPFVDAITVIGNGARSVGYALAVHGSAALYGLVLGTWRGAARRGPATRGGRVKAHLVATTLALLGAGVVYGTDVFGALVLVPAAARARDASVADLLGWIHELGDRRMPVPGMLGLLGSLASARLAPSSPARALALAAFVAQVVWLVIYATVSAPLNRHLRAAARANETPPETRAWQVRWGAVIWPRALLQAVAVGALLAAVWAT